MSKEIIFIISFKEVDVVNIHESKTTKNLLSSINAV